MLTFSWRLSAAIHYYLTMHAPSNQLIARIRPHRRRRVVVAAGLAAAVYIVLAALCADAARGGGVAWLNGVAGLLIWDGFKFAWVALLHVRTGWPHRAESNG